MKTYDYKSEFLDSIFRKTKGKRIKVLDMGCGTSKNIPQLLREYPNILYTGVELDSSALSKARIFLKDFPEVTLIDQYGEHLKSNYNNNFDVTFSLSVLEHVKYLDNFLQTSIDVTKVGGKIIHRYDLGHALHSKSLKERFKIILCKHSPFLIPASRFTTHPQSAQIADFFEKRNVEVSSITYSQIPCLKGLVNKLDWESQDQSLEVGRKIVELDHLLANYMQTILSEKEMEYSFPTVSIYGRKKEKN